VGKTLMTVEGIGKEIAPDLDIMEESRPVFLEILKKRYSPERLGSDLLRRLDRLGSITNTLPEQVQEVLDDLRLGRLSVRASSGDLRIAAETIAERILLGLLVGALVLAAALLYVNSEKTAGLALAALSVFALFSHALRSAWRSLRGRP
jgi:ubiquinone biosynthesis protein